MTRLARVWILLLIPIVSAGEAGAPAKDFEAPELTTLAREAGRAYARRDLVTLERISADDYVQTDVRGGVLGRAEWLQFVKDRSSDLTISCGDIRMRRYGEAAVVTGEWIYTSHQEEGGDIVTRWTSVWTQEPDGWKRHLFQNTYVNPKGDRCAMGQPH
jgi:ketosteroid isomerase-like protein